MAFTCDRCGRVHIGIEECAFDEHLSLKVPYVSPELVDIPIPPFEPYPPIQGKQ